jgi:Uma2 family endonuclease
MSTVRRPPTKLMPPLKNGQRLDQPAFHKRYEAMPPDTRAELIGGIVYMPSPVSGDHGEPASDVGGWLFLYKTATPGVRSPSDTTVILGADSEPQPDNQLWIPAELGGQVTLDRHGYVTGAPEMVVEIARSSRSFDLNEKKADYERAGVLEYVVVEVDPDRIHWFVRRENRFEKLASGQDGIYRSEVFPGLWLDARALFSEDRRKLIAVLNRGLRTRAHAAFAAELATKAKAARKS